MHSHLFQWMPTSLFSVCITFLICVNLLNLPVIALVCITVVFTCFFFCISSFLYVQSPPPLLFLSYLVCLVPLETWFALHTRLHWGPATKSAAPTCPRHGQRSILRPRPMTSIRVSVDALTSVGTAGHARAIQVRYASLVTRTLATHPSKTRSALCVPPTATNSSPNR